MLQSAPRADALPDASAAAAAAPQAPGAPRQANMVFMLSAPAAALTPSSLTLTGVSSVATFVTDDRKSGATRMGAHPHPRRSADM